jgi:hypothetical protein
MTNKPVPEPLSDLLESYSNVNAFSVCNLANDLHTSIHPDIAEKFRLQLFEAINEKTITPEQYELLTGEDFDTQDDLDAWLRHLWDDLYGQKDAPV